MSMILDALRKMEQDRRFRHQGLSGLRPDVLSYRGRRDENHRKPLLFLTMGAVLVVCGIGLGIWAFSGNSGVQSRQAVQETRSGAPSEPQKVTPLLEPSRPVSGQASVASFPTTYPPPVRKIPPAVTTPPVAEPTGNSGITISGIAWQEERELRRAVINGALVGEGADVAGARVLEIKENRVRFSRGGQTFEVLHSTAFQLH